jgi:hypothetical protein
MLRGAAELDGVLVLTEGSAEPSVETVSSSFIKSRRSGVPGHKRDWSVRFDSRIQGKSVLSPENKEKLSVYLAS